MTMLAVTVAKDRVLISQDNLIIKESQAYRENAARSAGLSASPDRSIETCYAGGGGPATVDVIGSGCKIFSFPRLNMAMAGTGDLGFLLEWWQVVSGQFFADILQLDRVAPDLLREHRRQRGNNNPFCVVHAGWSRSAGTCIGRAYSFDRDFEPVDIPVGSTLGAAPDPDDPAYDEIAALWAAAGRGEHMERCHAALYGQQQRSFMAGRLAPGVAVGGGLVHCRVDQHGIRMETASTDPTDAGEADTNPGDMAPMGDLSGLADVAAE